MSRVQLALDVDDLDEAVTFYTKLLGTGPAKRKPGYANFAVVDPPLKLVLLENPGRGGSINHLGVEVADSATVHAEIARLTGEGLFPSEEIGTTCCFATQDKVWVTGPGGERWEVYTVLADSDSPGSSPTTLVDAGQVADSSVCCGTAQAQDADDRAAPAGPGATVPVPVVTRPGAQPPGARTPLPEAAEPHGSAAPRAGTAGAPPPAARARRAAAR